MLVPGLAVHARGSMPSRFPALWRFGPVMVADHRRDDTMDGDRARAFSPTAPPRFALAGLSMGGYIALAIMRQAPERVARLALARHRRARRHAGADRAPQRADRARAGRPVRARSSICIWPLFVHRDRQRRRSAATAIVRTMAEETGAEAFVRQQQAIMTRPDSRPMLGGDQMPDAGAGRRRRRADAAGARRRKSPQAFPAARLVIVPDCGHLSTLERPEAVNQRARGMDAA